MNNEPIFKEIEFDDHTCHMTLQEFKDAVESGCFIDYDGIGYLATADKESN